MVNCQQLKTLKSGRKSNNVKASSPSPMVFRIMTHTFIHTDVNTMMESFRYDAHPMGMLVSTLAAVSTLHPEANPALAGEKVYYDKKVRNKQIHRLLGNVPTLAANAYRHRIGRNYNKPQKDLGYIEVNTSL